MYYYASIDITKYGDVVRIFNISKFITLRMHSSINGHIGTQVNDRFILPNKVYILYRLPFCTVIHSLASLASAGHAGYVHAYAIYVTPRASTHVGYLLAAVNNI